MFGRIGSEIAMKIDRAYFMKTERLGFSKWSDEDKNLALLLWGNPQVTHFISATGRFEVEDIEKRLRLEIENEKKFQIQYWPLFHLESGELVGCCGFRPYKEGWLEMGFHLRPEFWKKGYGYEAARAAIDYVFTNTSIEGLFAGHHPNNESSKKLINKLGFTYAFDNLYLPTGLYHPSYEMKRL